MRAHDRLELVWRAEQREPDEILVSTLRLSVDEPDDVQAVLVVAEQLAGDALADITGAENERVLLVERAATAERTSGCARQCDEHDGGSPQHGCARHGRVREPADLEPDERDPGSDRHEMEDADDLVRRRMVSSFLVLVVEVVQARHCDPDRERDDGGDEDMLVRCRADEPDYRERERQPDEIGDDQSAPDEPAAPPAAARRSPHSPLEADVTAELRGGHLGPRDALRLPHTPHVFHSKSIRPPAQAG